MTVCKLYEQMKLRNGICTLIILFSDTPKASVICRYYICISVSNNKDLLREKNAWNDTDKMSLNVTYKNSLISHMKALKTHFSLSFLL